jgi:CRISPR-associated exonuclease Cas4
MSFEDEELIPVYFIKRFHFCPRTVYFEAVLGYKEYKKEYMIEGEEEHEREERKIERRKNVFPYSNEEVLELWNGLNLKSEKLGIMGKIDSIVKTKKGTYLIERKNSYGYKKPNRDHLYQAAAYALLAEENLKIKIDYIKIHYLKNNKIFTIKLSQDLRKHVIWTIEKIKEIIDKAYLYPFVKKPYCEGCGFADICKNFR